MNFESAATATIGDSLRVRAERFRPKHGHHIRLHHDDGASSFLGYVKQISVSGAAV